MKQKKSILVWLFWALALVVMLMPVNTVTAQAARKTKTYKVVYNLNGGTNSKNNPKTVAENKSVTLKSPTRTGYTFKGWYKDKKFKTKTTKVKGTRNAKNRTVYAKWKKNPKTYKVIYNLNGGTNHKSNPKTVAENKSVTLKSPTRTGYTFKGWYKDKKFKTKTTKVKGTRSAKNRTVYAKWKKKPADPEPSKPADPEPSKPADPTPSKPLYKIPANVTFASRTETYDGKEHVIVAENIPVELRVTYINNSRTNAGSQEARAEFSLSTEGLKRYSGIDGNCVRTAILTIDPAEPSYPAPAELTAVFGQTLGDIADQLGNGFSFEDPLDTPVGESDENEFTVTYTPDSDNYKTVRGIKVTIHVKMTYLLPSNVSFPAVEETYSGNTFTASVKNLPDHIVAVSYFNNTRSGVGVQTARAVFSIKPEYADSYIAVEPAFMETTITIRQADGFILPEGLTAKVGQTLGDIADQLGSGFSFKDPLDTPVGLPGENEFDVLYTSGSGDDEVVKVTVHVTAADRVYILPSDVRFPDIEEVYNGNPFTATVKNLSDPVVAVKYSNNTRRNAGEQTARVEFSINPAFADQYDSVYPSSMEAGITVYKALPDYTLPTGLTAKVGQTLGDIEEPLGEGFEFMDPLTTSVGSSAGTIYVLVKYTPPDTENYKVIEGISVSIQVSYEDNGPDRSELDLAIEEAEAVVRSEYTEESYALFLKAYDEAKNMPENDQDEVDEKADAVMAALGLLEKVGNGGA